MKRNDIPKSSTLAKSRYDYFDCYEESANIEKHLPVEDLAKAFFLSAPQSVRKLMTVRNRIATLLGLKTGTQTHDEIKYIKQLPMQVGDRIGLFEVIEKLSNEIVIGTDDSHLNFRVSLLKEIQNTGHTTINMTTTVQFHNRMGKLYFLIVGPFHRWIAPSMLRRMVRLLP